MGAEHQISLARYIGAAQEARGNLACLPYCVRESFTDSIGWQIKDGWGWIKWSVDAWEECRMSDHNGEYLKDWSVL